jgi:hypothetical protein
MEESRDRVRPLSAVLQGDGSIEVELAIPEQEETVTTTIDGTKASRWLVIPDSIRVIDLDDVGDQENASLRRMVDQYIVLVERHITEQRAQRAARQGKRGRSDVGAR